MSDAGAPPPPPPPPYGQQPPGSGQPPPPPPPYGYQTQYQQPYQQPYAQPGWQQPQPMPFGYAPGAVVAAFIPSRSPIRRVSRWLGILVLLGGIVSGAILFILGFVNQSRDIAAFPRGSLPAATLHLVEGDFTIFVEGDGLTHEDDDDHCELCSEAQASRVSVTGPDGAPVPTQQYFGTSSYSFGHEGVALATISIEAEGDYLVAVDPSLPQIREVAVGDYGFTSLAVSAGIGFGLFFGGLVIGLPLMRFGRRGR